MCLCGSIGTFGNKQILWYTSFCVILVHLQASFASPKACWIWIWVWESEQILILRTHFAGYSRCACRGLESCLPSTCTVQCWAGRCLLSHLFCLGQLGCPSTSSRAAGSVGRSTQQPSLHPPCSDVQLAAGSAMSWVALGFGRWGWTWDGCIEGRGRPSIFRLHCV
jgi:hypothetical protein